MFSIRASRQRSLCNRSLLPERLTEGTAKVCLTVWQPAERGPGGAVTGVTAAVAHDGRLAKSEPEHLATAMKIQRLAREGSTEQVTQQQPPRRDCAHRQWPPCKARSLPSLSCPPPLPSNLAITQITHTQALLPLMTLNRPSETNTSRDQPLC